MIKTKSFLFSNVFGTFEISISVDDSGSLHESLDLDDDPMDTTLKLKSMKYERNCSVHQLLLLFVFF